MGGREKKRRQHPGQGNPQAILPPARDREHRGLRVFRRPSKIPAASAPAGRRSAPARP
jgi:hypothetical protein